jgi:hypothetical protein
VLDRRAGSSGDPKALAVAAQRAYDDLARVSAPLIGHAGVEALTGRALHLARQQYPWLIASREPAPADGAFAQAVLCLERQTPPVAADAAVTVFALWTGLLVTFIGDSLTAGLLQKAWPDAFSEAPPGETQE